MQIVSRSAAERPLCFWERCSFNCAKSGSKAKWHVLHISSLLVDVIPHVGTGNRVGSGRFGSKIIGSESGFGLVPRVETVGSGRFQQLEPKPDPTVSLISNWVMK